MLNENIHNKRKKANLTQEELAEKINVSRQTISNWELGSTSPNPEQLKLLSKTLKVSIDELLDNDVKGVIEEKVSNTEKLAGLIIKILKGFAIVFLTFILLDIIALLFFTFYRKEVKESYVSNITLECQVEEEDYLISVGNDGYFNCSNCDKQIHKDLYDKYIDFGDLEASEENIKNYFKNHNGICE